MLGRTANDLFWLSRYVERAENMARLVEAGYRIALLPYGSGTGRQDWRSTLDNAGCAHGYYLKHSEAVGQDVIDYLVFDEDNPSSIRSCLATARRNARAQRTSLTREMWECLNDSWLHFSQLHHSSMRSDELPNLLDWVKERSAAYRGALLNTILRNDTFFFSQLGTFLERADNTSRILDAKYYVLLPRPEMVGSGVDSVQWGAILRSVSAHRSYRWVYKENYKPWRIADYLILNKAMPRSLRSCYGEIVSAIDDLRDHYGMRDDRLDLAGEVMSQLETAKIDDIFQSGLHEFLQSFIARNNRLGLAVSEVFHFNP